MIVEIVYRLETDAEPAILNLVLSVTETHDPYGTGNSPTQLEVEFVSCVASDGNDYEFTNLSNFDVTKIGKIACNKYRGYS